MGPRTVRGHTKCTSSLRRYEDVNIRLEIEGSLRITIKHLRAWTECDGHTLDLNSAPNPEEKERRGPSFAVANEEEEGRTTRRSRRDTDGHGRQQRAECEQHGGSRADSSVCKSSSMPSQSLSVVSYFAIVGKRQGVGSDV